MRLYFFGYLPRSRRFPYGRDDTAEPPPLPELLPPSPAAASFCIDAILSRRYAARSKSSAAAAVFISEVSSWASDDLDSICSDLTLRESGQAYRIIDLMAARGYLSFSDGQDFSERISANLHCADFSVFCLDGKRGAAD